MDQKFNPSHESNKALAAVRGGIGTLSTAFRERPLLFVGLGLAALATAVVRLNARRAGPHTARRLRRHPAAKKSGAPARRGRRPARGRKSSARAA